MVAVVWYFGVAQDHDDVSDVVTVMLFLINVYFVINFGLALGLYVCADENNVCCFGAPPAGASPGQAEKSKPNRASAEDKGSLKSAQKVTSKYQSQADTYNQ